MHTPKKGRLRTKSTQTAHRMSLRYIYCYKAALDRAKSDCFFSKAICYNVRVFLIKGDLLVVTSNFGEQFALFRIFRGVNKKWPPKTCLSCKISEIKFCSCNSSGFVHLGNFQVWSLFVFDFNSCNYNGYP